MRVTPGQPDTARCVSLPSPEPGPGDVLVESLLVGLCGTDREVLRQGSGPAITIGHEVVGRVVSAPDGTGWRQGDLVVGVIRRPCPERCPACAAGALDRCVSPDLHERGIRHLDGFGSDQWTSPPEYLVRIPPELGERGVLVEPATSAVKGVRRLLATYSRDEPQPKSALVLGLGTLGLLATLVLTQLGIEVDVRDPKSGRRHELATALGATTHAPGDNRYDLLVDCSGDESAVLLAMPSVVKQGRVLLLGIYSGIQAPDTTLGVALTHAVLGDLTMLGSVNASLADHKTAVDVLSKAPQDWLHEMVTRELDPERWVDGTRPTEDDIKTVVRFNK